MSKQLKCFVFDRVGGSEVGLYIWKLSGNCYFFHCSFHMLQLIDIQLAGFNEETLIFLRLQINLQ